MLHKCIYEGIDGGVDEREGIDGGLSEGISEGLGVIVELIVGLMRGLAGRKALKLLHASVTVRWRRVKWYVVPFVRVGSISDVWG